MGAANGLSKATPAQRSNECNARFFTSATDAGSIPLHFPTMSPQSPASRLFWPLLLMGTLLWASHWNVAPMMPEIEWIAPDKAVHFAVYGLLATLWLRFFSSHRRIVPAAFLGWLVTAGFGLADELVQSFNPVRTFDPADLVADASGAFVAVLLYAGASPYRQFLEFRFPRRSRS